MADGLRVQFYGAARSVAGMTAEEVPVPAGLWSVAQVLDSLVARHGPQLHRVLRRCSYLRNSIAVHDLGESVCAGDTIDVLPPFAGG